MPDITHLRKVAEAERKLEMVRCITKAALRGHPDIDTPEASVSWLRSHLQSIEEATVLSRLEKEAATPERPCTCHPDDNPPRPCPRKYALTDCRLAAETDKEPSHG
jgi:hypothetical protein